MFLHPPEARITIRDTVLRATYAGIRWWARFFSYLGGNEQVSAGWRLDPNATDIEMFLVYYLNLSNMRSFGFKVL